MELRSHALLILSFIASLLPGRGSREEEAAVVVIAAPVPVPGKEKGRAGASNLKLLRLENVAHLTCSTSQNTGSWDPIFFRKGKKKNCSSLLWQSHFHQNLLCKRKQNQNT
jgi:hypothetical protein